jgi:F-box-like
MDNFKMGPYREEPLAADDFAAIPTKQPVFKLSPELLSNIFIEYAALHSQPSIWGTLLLGHLKWIAVTHVCRYWRSVALGCTTLWKRLCFFNPEVTKEMIRRAKGSNLEVNMKCPTRKKLSAVVDEALRMVIPELYHISVLHLELHKNVLQPLFDGSVSAAPNLECLLLRSSSDDLDNKLRVPETIFAQKMPVLHTLELKYCTLVTPSPSSSTSDPHLVHIPLTMSQIVSYLRRMPTLHTLMFCEVLPEEVSADTEYPRLNLPELSNLTLIGSITSCINFLERLVFPPTTATTIRCERLLPNANYHGLFHAFRSAFGNGEVDFVIQALEIKEIAPQPPLFHLRYTLTHRHSSLPTIVTFAFNCQNRYQGMIEDVLGAASRTISHTDIHDLVLAFDDSSCVSGVRRHLPNILNIRFEAYSRDFINALGDRDSPMLPRLQNLQFVEVYFSQQGVTTLLNCLESRSLSGLPIKTIHLRQCMQLFEEDVTRIKEFVQDVDWDGHEEDVEQEWGEWDGHEEDVENEWDEWGGHEEHDWDEWGGEDNEVNEVWDGGIHDHQVWDGGIHDYPNWDGLIDDWDGGIADYPDFDGDIEDYPDLFRDEENVNEGEDDEGDDVDYDDIEDNGWDEDYSVVFDWMF